MKKTFIQDNPLSLHKNSESLQHLNLHPLHYLLVPTTLRPCTPPTYNWEERGSLSFQLTVWGRVWVFAISPAPWCKSFIPGRRSWEDLSSHPNPYSRGGSSISGTSGRECWALTSPALASSWGRRSTPGGANQDQTLEHGFLLRGKAGHTDKEIHCFSW